MNKSENTLARVKSVRATDGGAHLILAVEISEGEEARRETLTLCTSRLSCTPRVGNVDEELLAYYRRENEVAGALRVGLRAISYSYGSAVKLGRKLREKGFSKEVADEVIAELERRGLFSEAEAAVREAERCLAKLWGNRRIQLHLQSKGYKEEAYGAAYMRMLEDDGVARCRRLLQKRHIANLPADKREADKIVAMLMRYGYSTKEIKAAFQTDEE